METEGGGEGKKRERERAVGKRDEDRGERGIVRHTSIYSVYGSFRQSSHDLAHSLNP